MKKNKSNIIKDIVNKTPLDIKLKVTVRMAMIHSLTELGYRENKSWGDDEEEQLYKLYSLADDLSNDIMKLVEHENKKK